MSPGPSPRTASSAVSSDAGVEPLTWATVRAWRLGRQHLIGRLPEGRMLEAVRDVGGVHAQVQSSAELQVWARVEGVRREGVREALWERRTLVRTWCLRGTLHLLAAEDLPLYVAALRTHDRWWKGAWLRMIGFEAEELRAILDAIRDSLGARPMTREQLAEAVAKRVGPEARRRMLSGWGEMLKPAAFEGSLISGPPRGQQVTFVRPDRWLAGWREPPAEEAWPEIVRRYLRAYGPASREDFARWWGMQPPAAGRILKGSSVDLAPVDVEGSPAFTLAGDVAEIRSAKLAASVRLLPAFDVYVAGTRPRSSLVDPRFEDRVFRAAGWISPVVLVKGMAAGVWRHDRTGRELQVTVEPFGKLTAAQRQQIAAEADRLGAFLDAPAAVRYE
jgi:winged helix DNA-binding protein